MLPEGMDDLPYPYHFGVPLCALGPLTLLKSQGGHLVESAGYYSGVLSNVKVQRLNLRRSAKSERDRGPSVSICLVFSSVVLCPKKESLEQCWVRAAQ